MSATRLSIIMTSALLIGVTFASFLLSSLSTAYAASKKATAATSTAQVLAPQPDFCTNLYDKSQDDREKLIKEMATGICQGNNSPQCIAKESAKIVKGCVAKSTGQQQDGESCKDSYDKFQKEDKELRAACSSVPIDGDCFTHVNKCLKCQGSDSTDSICASLETEEIDSDLNPDSKPASISDYLNAGQSTSASTTKYTPDRKKAAIRYKNCPAMAGTDLEKWITRVRDAQTAASDSKKRIIELQEKNNEIEAQLNDTKIEKQREMQDATTEAEDAKQQMLNDMDKEKNEARKTVAALLEQSTVIENQIAATQKAYDDAYRTYLDAMAKLDDLCYAEAKQKLAAAQIAAQEKIKNSQYSTNSLNSLLGQVGISSRVKAQSRVNEDFRFCKRDPTHQAQITMAKRALDSAKQAANQARQSLEAKKNQIALTIQDANQRELPEALQRVVANTNRTLAKLQEKIQQLALDLQNETNKANTKMATNNQNIALARSEAAVAEQTLQQYQSYLNQKMVASGGVETDSEKVSQALNALTTTEAAAGTAASSCGCTQDPGSAENVKYCKDACTVLVKSRSDWNPQESISDDMLVSECSALGKSTTSSTLTRTPTATPSSAPAAGSAATSSSTSSTSPKNPSKAHWPSRKPPNPKGASPGAKN